MNVSSPEETLRLLFQDSSVELSYVSDHNTVYLISNSNYNRWPSRILRQNRATIDISGSIQHGSARLVTDGDQKGMIVELFRNKYGAQYVKKYFNSISRIVTVSLSVKHPQGVPDYYAWLEDEFDNIATEYDRHIYGNRVNTLLRNRSLRIMKEAFQGAGHILEVGCGTGTETIEMLREGYEITATDISSKMLDIISRKARDEGLSESLTLCRVRAGNISSISNIDGYAPFDGAYSNFGALNCEGDVSIIPGQIHDLLVPGALFVAGIYNRLCVTEILSYILTLQFRKASDRLKKMSPEGKSRFCVDVYAYTPGEFISKFSGFFDSIRTYGAPVIIPPSNLVEYVEKFSGHFDLIDRLDYALSGIWPFKYLGDHFITVMRRK